MRNQVKYSSADVEDKAIIDEIKKTKIRKSFRRINPEDFWGLIVKIERYYESKYNQRVAELKGRYQL